MTKTCLLKNGEEYTLCQLQETDAEKLLLYTKKVAGETNNLTFSPDEFTASVDDERKLIKANLERKNLFALAGVYKNEIIAFMNFKAGARNRVAHIGEFGMSVLKEYWGNGIGSELLKSLFEWAEANSITKINLKVKEDNERAISLYKKMGFENVQKSEC